jgi:glycosyltransferase involved in cell wall biosynthesis
MKILMLTPYLPYPPSSGGQVRSYNLIKHLSKKHEIYLVALIKTAEEEKYSQHLKEYCKQIYVCKRSESPWTFKNIAKSIFGRFPFLVVRNFSSPAKRIITDLLQQNSFDLIHAETFYIMPHIPKTEIPILLVEQTIEYRVYQHFVNNLRFPFLKPFFYYDILKLIFWEKTFWKKANVVGAVSEEDKRSMRKLLPTLRIEIIPNAAGEDLFNIYTDKKRIEPIFLYQGNFSWLQNIEAAQILAKKVFPKIREKIPNAICLIAGQNATSKIDNLKGNGIEVIDIPPSSSKTVQDIYSRASIFLAPIEGPGGTRLKILGAMAAGLPVISSPTGVAGLAVDNNTHVLIAKNYDVFVEKSVDLLQNSKTYNQIRQNARQLIIEKYSWEKISADLERIYLKVCQEG